MFLHLGVGGFWLAQSRAAARPRQKEPVGVGTSQVRFSRHVPPGGGPRDPGQTGVPLGKVEQVAGDRGSGFFA